MDSSFLDFVGWGAIKKTRGKRVEVSSIDGAVLTKCAVDETQQKLEFVGFRYATPNLQVIFNRVVLE